MGIFGDGNLGPEEQERCSFIVTYPQAVRSCYWNLTDLLFLSVCFSNEIEGLMTSR